MKDIDEIRRENLCVIERAVGGPSKAAKLLEMSPAQFGNLRNGAKDSRTGKPRGMRKETARRVEALAGKPPGWLDTEHQDTLATAQARQVRANGPVSATDDKQNPFAQTQHTIDACLGVIIGAIFRLAQDQRKALAEHLAVLALAPDSAQTRAKVQAALEAAPPSVAEQILGTPATIESPRLPPHR